MGVGEEAVKVFAKFSLWYIASMNSVVIDPKPSWVRSNAVGLISLLVALFAIGLAVWFFFIFPTTELTICMTWEYFSIIILSFSLTLPVVETLPISFLPKSMSMVCSASSFSSLSSSTANFSSSFSSLPRLLVPAMGRVSIMSFSTLTIISGDDPIMAESLKFSRNIYGEGLSLRKFR